MQASLPTPTVINGAPISTINKATLIDPDVLDEYVALGEELRADLARSRSQSAASS